MCRIDGPSAAAAAAKNAPPAAAERRTWNRADFDAYYEKAGSSCPGPSDRPLRKTQWLPFDKTGPLHSAFLELIRIPLGVVLCGVALALNLVFLVWTYVVRGGLRENALRTTQPRGNFLVRWLLRSIDIYNVTEIPKAWDPDKAAQAFELFRTRNHFAPEDVLLETHPIGEQVTTNEVVHRYHKAEVFPAKLHRVWVLCGPTRTYICTASAFDEFDGTSCLNLVKGFVETYYEGIAPKIRPVEGDPELDLRLTKDPQLLKELTLPKALLVCVVSAFRFGYAYGRNLFSRELVDMLHCPYPGVCASIEFLSKAENERMMRNLKTIDRKMFAHLMVSTAKALRECTQRVDKPILLTQVSCQSRYYEPRIQERNVCGNWLIGAGSVPHLNDLANPSWCHAYYQQLREDLENFQGSVAFSFIAQTMLGFTATALWSNPRKIYWFNNYGLRKMHPDAGGVRYFWGPNYTVSTYCLVNAVTIDGTTCLTLGSSVLPQGEVERAAALVKKHLLFELDEEDEDANETKDKDA